MREYETLYLLKPDLPLDIGKTLQDKLSEIVKKTQGHILSRADWGKRRLAYRIQKFRHAQYLYMQFLDAGQSVAEIERILKYDDRVLRYLTVKLKEKVNVEERLAKPVEAPPPPEEFHSPEMEEGRGGGRYDRPRHSGGDDGGMDDGGYAGRDAGDRQQ